MEVLHFYGQHIIESIFYGVAPVLLIYGAFCIFIRWLRAWKPVPKLISIFAWLFYALVTVFCAAGFFNNDLYFFFTLLPFVVIVPICYAVILIYRKKYFTENNDIEKSVYLGHVFFIVLTIVILLLIGLLWFGAKSRELF